MEAIFSRTAPSLNLHQAALLLMRSPSRSEITLPHSASAISGLELAAGSLAIYHFRATMRHRSITIYIDNSAALSALVNGDSPASPSFFSVAKMWVIATSRDVAILRGRMRSKRDIADLPTRNTPPLPGIGYPPPYGSNRIL